MDGIRKRGNGFFVDVTVQGKRRTATAATLELAQVKQAQLKLDLLTEANNQAAKASCWTIAEASAECVKAIWKGTANEEAAHRNADYAVQFFGKDTLLDNLGTKEIDAYIAHLTENGNSKGTVNRKLAALSRVMSFARESEMMVRRPKVRRQLEDEGRTRFLTDDEEATLLHTLSDRERDCHAEAVSVLVDTGMRLSELWRVQAKDIHLKQGPHGLLSIWKTKNSHPRSVPMTLRVREILTRRMELTPKGPLFPHTNSWFRQGWDAARAEMGFTNDQEFVPHSLRHTCATRLFQKGAKPLTVQNWMGHETMAITQRYTHLQPEDMFDAVLLLEGGQVTRPQRQIAVGE